MQELNNLTVIATLLSQRCIQDPGRRAFWTPPSLGFRLPKFEKNFRNPLGCPCFYTFKITIYASKLTHLLKFCASRITISGCALDTYLLSHGKLQEHIKNLPALSLKVIQFSQGTMFSPKTIKSVVFARIGSFYKSVKLPAQTQQPFGKGYQHMRKPNSKH